MTVKILGENEDFVTVGGYGILFGGEDLVGDTFDKDTDLELDLVPNKPLFYEHRYGEVKHALGTVVKAEVREDVGLWVEAQIEKAKDYATYVIDLIKKGLIGLSSGTAEHLVDYLEKVNGGVKFTKFPIIEFSLTPRPAEPRTLGVDVLKSMSAEYPELEAFIPKELGEGSEGANKGAKNKSQNENKENKVDEIKLTMQEYKDLLKSQVAREGAENVTIEGEPREAEDKSLKDLSARVDQILEMVENAPSLKDVGFVAPDSEGDDHKETKSLADFLLAVKRRNYSRINKVYNTKAQNETTDADGAVLVPTELEQPIIANAMNFSVLRDGATIIPLGSKSVEVPFLDVTSAPLAGDTAFAGGVVAYWEGEADELAQSDTAWDMVELVAHKLAGYTLASNEVREDAATSIDAILATMFGRAVGSKENYAFLRGTGTDRPEGILPAPATIAVNREVASEVSLADLANMMTSLLPNSWSSGMWIMNPTVANQLIQLVSNPLSFMENLRSGMPMQLLGMPLKVTGALPALGTKGDLLLVDPSYYLIGDRKGLSIAYSEHHRFIFDQATWRFTKRVDGKPWVSGPITLEDAATVVSPFVALDVPGV